MQKYQYSKAARSQWFVLPGMYVIAMLRSVGTLWSRIEYHTVDSRLVITNVVMFVLCVGGGFAGYILSGRRWYEADESEIKFKSLFGERSMVWRAVEKIEGGSTTFAPVVLTDHRGKKLTVNFGSLENRGAPLRELMNHQLERLLQRNAEEFKGKASTQGARSGSAGAVLAVFGALFFVGGIAFAVFGPTEVALGFGAIFCFFGLLLLSVGISVVTRKITVSDTEVCSKWALGETRLKISEIQSAYRYEGSNNSGPYELLTLRGPKGKIVLSSSLLVDYGLTRDRILSLLPEEALRSGDVARGKMLAGQIKQIGVILTICCSFFFFMGIWMAKDIRERVLFAQDVNTRGVWTTAKVTGDDCNCGSGTLRDIRYFYTVNGRDYVAVNRHTAQTAGISLNDTVQIKYLPENPGRSLLKVRLDPRAVVADSAMPALIALASPLLIPFALKAAKKSYQTQP